MSEHEYEHDDNEEDDYDEPDYDEGPSRKRRRDDNENGSRHTGHAGSSSAASTSRSSRSHAPPPLQPLAPDVPIAPSIFGIAPRNEFTKTVGEFIMANCRGVEHVEIEIKLGTLHAPGDPPRRIRMPTLSEMIMPPEYLVGPFTSTMTKAQHTGLNRLLNSAVESSQRSPAPLKFFRAQHEDSFYHVRGSNKKVRVSRDRATGAIVRDGIVRKRRLGDLNVYSPREELDWRISVNIEEPAELPPEGTPAVNVRKKDRACYRHQLVQVDLTVVTSVGSETGGQPQISYELEIEVVDVASLVAEGEKEERGEPNRFDDMLQSVMDTARMLVRNI